MDGLQAHTYFIYYDLFNELRSLVTILARYYSIQTFSSKLNLPTPYSMSGNYDACVHQGAAEQMHANFGCRQTGVRLCGATKCATPGRVPNFQPPFHSGLSQVEP